jgi:ribonuclease P/MRP protein subunit RPP40
LENGGNIDAIYTDFQKAFDKVPHKKLLSELQAYGITDEIVSLIKDFLCNRNQRVRINGKFFCYSYIYEDKVSRIAPLFS